METTLFEALGGEPVIRRIVDAFYDRIDKSTVFRSMFPADLAETRTKTFEFLVGWTGGPQLYMEKYGHPRLRMRHMPFPIGTVERNEWMRCMSEAVTEVGVDPKAGRAFFDSLWKTADFLRNKPEGT